MEQMEQQRMEEAHRSGNEERDAAEQICELDLAGEDRAH
jgi:hypothetical protein